ncbi:MAG: 16S rRNA (adenine(1518)-N(6)/adenine(1519)-N(6))-dimethyltransferase RsmA [Peptococcaceae bacterium]|nr:16S rRNA (adenine(1518)-N(6)/adenine(1519)-N(6))-dimethyltransferase RsmA [Peptococcaceae bacterium]
MKSKETARAYTSRLLKKTQRIRREFGQHFLIDDSIISRMVAQIPANVLLLEVGAGLGVMTREFIGRHPEFWAIELDREKAEILREEYHVDSCNPPFNLLTGDALQTNLTDLWPAQRGWVAGNLPYYITNPLIMHFLQQKSHLEAMIIMIQKEVAARICAPPGRKDYGVLSIAVQASAQADILFDVPPHAFVPAPKVTSTVLALHMRPHPDLAASDEKGFFRIVKAAFSSRRKTLTNSLAAGLALDKSHVAKCLMQTDIDGTRRAETLSIAEFQQVAQALSPDLIDLVYRQNH